LKSEGLDATVVGAGPNGLAAAITLARAGYSVKVYEAADTVGGGTRSAELTLPGFIHDVCSAVHPLAAASPFFRNIRLQELGVDLVHPGVPLAHPLDDGSAAVLERSVQDAAAGLGSDGPAYNKLMAPLVRDAPKLIPTLLGPPTVPGHPLALLRFGLRGARSARGLSNSLFTGTHARALLAGLAAHSMLPVESSPTAGFGLFLGLLGHHVGWPVAKGGSQVLADALARYLRTLGGDIATGEQIEHLKQLPKSKVCLLDLTPRQIISVAGDALPKSYIGRLGRFRYGPGVFKLDLATSEPIPWNAAKCREAGTVHLGGSLEEIAFSERQVAAGEHADRPFVLLAQPSIFDSTRSPEGKHTVWAYCHVPNSSAFDMTERIEAQIERFAPGFKDCILARAKMTSNDLQNYNQNYVGGDINGGSEDLRQLFTRPTVRPPYRTPNPRLFICSSSTPPGGGVHGMCGYHAAKAALRGPLL